MIGAGFDTEDFFQDAVLISVDATGEPAEWARMIEELVVEVRRVREYGFTDWRDLWGSSTGRADYH